MFISIVLIFKEHELPFSGHLPFPPGGLSRSLQTLAGVLRTKKIVCTLFFKEIPTNDVYFPKAPGALNAKQTDCHSSELMEYQMRSLMQNNFPSTNHKASVSQKYVSISFYFYWLSFYRSVKFRGE